MMAAAALFTQGMARQLVIFPLSSAVNNFAWRNKGNKFSCVSVFAKPWSETTAT